MQLLRVFLIRHGQSMYQSLKIVSGKNELGLSGLGIVQSKRAGTLLQNLKFDQVYTSDYKRCIESYTHIENQLKQKPRVITYTPLLREVNQGEETLKSYQDVSLQSQPKQSSDLNNEIQERVETFLHQLIRDQIQMNPIFLLYTKNLINLQLIIQQQFPYRHQLGSQIDTNNFYNPSVQQFSSYSKESGMIKVLVLSHAGFIAQTLRYLHHRQNSHLSNSEQPCIYAKNGAIFLLDFYVSDLESWDCKISLTNWKRGINTPFDLIN